MALQGEQEARPGGLTARERTCAACGATSTTFFERCPACGVRYDAPAAGHARRRVILAAIMGGVVLAVAIAGIVLALRSKADRLARDRVASARVVAAERARLRRLQAPHRGGAPALAPPARASVAQRLAARRALVVAVQDAITADARRRVGTRELEGPILRTECGPILRAPDAVPDDRVLSRAIGRYDCIAVHRSVGGTTGTVANLGYPYVTALDFRRFTWTFCRNTPPQGERGQALAQVRLDRACLAARGRALGTGYVDTGERP
jgi:hypothetical protein